MNESVNPCENFYEFACGNFVKNTKPINGWTDPFGILSRKVQNLLFEMLGEKIPPNEIKAIRLAKDFYSSCSNTTAIESRGLEPLTDILSELGGWPILEGDSWSESEFDWVEMLKQLKRIGLEEKMILGLTVGRSLTNSSQYVLYV